MSLNSTPSSERLHIAFFGRRNAGKSSLINAITNQNLSIVSDIKGTTTDPVNKAMELLPLGPVVIIDTPGIDDVGELGLLRVEKTYQVLAKTDIAVLVIDSSEGKCKEDFEIIEEFKKRKIPYIVVWNKIDKAMPDISEGEIGVSVQSGENIEILKEKIAEMGKKKESGRRIIGDFIGKNDFVVLVIPIDESAPKGRLILPQQQTIRDILDSDATAIAVKPSELKATLEKLNGLVKLVVTDSQAFAEVDKKVPKNIPLTSFSILFARYKGDLRTTVEGASVLDLLKDGARVLISEGCTHHRQCGDIGTVKLPALIKKYTNKSIEFEWTSGTEFPKELGRFDLIIHCGGCMLNENEVKNRFESAKNAGVPMTNYGIAIAKMNGILQRSLEIFDGNY